MSDYESLLRFVALKAEPNEFHALEEMREALLLARRSLDEHRCGTGLCHCCKAIAAIDAAMKCSDESE